MPIARPADDCVGLAKGPGEKPFHFTFITPDSEDCLPIGEFIYYPLPDAQEERKVVCRIEERRECRNYPSAFLAHPHVPPAELAALIGYDPQTEELFEVTASVLGYYDEELGDFINPRRLPRVGHPIYRAPGELLQRVINRKQPGQPGSALIGSLLSRRPGEVPVVLDVSRFTATHLAIIAGTGSGKSYLAAVIVEEMMKPHNRGCVLIVDPHGEYDSLQELPNFPEFCEPGDGNLAEYRPRVRVLRPADIKVAYRSLELDDIRYLLQRDLSPKMSYALTSAYREVVKQTKGNWRLDQLKHAILNWAAQRSRQDLASDSIDYDMSAGQTAQSLIWRLDSVLGQGEAHIFNDYDDMPLQELFQPGQCTVLQLNDVPEREQQVLVATLLRRLFKARVATTTGQAGLGDPQYLPYPAFVVLEEAHNFAPASADLVTSEQLKRILSEGRKFGVGVCLITQRPGRLDPDVLSQCMTQVIMRITNEVDQARVAQSVESVGRALMAELPGLSKGQAVVAGLAINTPVLIRVRQRLTRHLAQDPDAPARWREYFSATEREESQRQSAVPLHSAILSEAQLYRELWGVEPEP